MKIIPLRSTTGPPSRRACLASLLALSLCLGWTSLAVVAAPLAADRGTPSPVGCGNSDHRVTSKKIRNDLGCDCLCSGVGISNHCYYQEERVNPRIRTLQG
jgi:hypothetical protein